MPTRDWVFVCSCVTCPGEDAGVAIRDMVDAASDIERDTFLRYVSRDELVTTERSLGYAHRPSHGLMMSRDWHVSYHRSTFRGRPCVYFRWSAIEFIFHAQERA